MSMIATYRLQLAPDFGFAEVEKILPYLKRLGVSHLYLSPITEARVGSTHGYDVVDHNLIRQEFGGEEGWSKLLDAVKAAGLSVILDFVPNHAGVGPHNEAWQSVLEHGAHSPFARYFDIDWDPLEESLAGKVLLPFLDQPYGKVLDEGRITLVREGDRFRAACGEESFSLSPVSSAEILAAAMKRHERSLLYFDLKELKDAYEIILPEDIHRAEMLRRRLAAIATQVNWSDALAEFQGEKLHALLERQHWRLAYWKAASYETNYRRFFDVNGLVALRMQDEEVFWSAHRWLSVQLAHEAVAGVRIDHVDGLFDPGAYLKRLREIGAKHIWVEKILAAGETIPADWPVEGSTGYEFMNDICKVLLPGSAMEAIERIYRRFTLQSESFDETVRTGKRLAMETSLASDLYRLSHELNQISKADYHTRDFALGALREALAEFIAAFDRYRSYLPYDVEGNREAIQTAAEKARRRTPAFEPSTYDYLVDVIMGNVPEALKEKQRAWVGRFQQYSTAVAAKGVEDTAFYRYVPLVALNEVGGAPVVGEHPLQSFHSHARFRAKRYPLNLLATATHDHKRGEDTRLRILALGELPELWEETLRGLSAIGDTYIALRGPSKQDQYLFYQTLLAQWCEPPREELVDRLSAYMLKASRESKQTTSWSFPDERYEESLQQLIHGIINDERTPSVIEPLAKEARRRAFGHSMSQLILKITSPGVPDFYQGCELLDLSLVDPDNRRSVDYTHRLALLSKMESLLERPAPGPLQDWLQNNDPLLKVYLTAGLLRTRKEFPDLFQCDVYREIGADGERPHQWIAFSRETEQQGLLVIVPRTSDVATDEDALSLPERFANQTLQETLSGTTLAVTDRLQLSQLPLRWGVLIATSPLNMASLTTVELTTVEQSTK